MNVPSYTHNILIFPLHIIGSISPYTHTCMYIYTHHHTIKNTNSSNISHIKPYFFRCHIIVLHIYTWPWINTYFHTIFRGMNIHKSQLFWCELQGIPWVLTHSHIIIVPYSLKTGPKTISNSPISCDKVREQSHIRRAEDLTGHWSRGSGAPVPLFWWDLMDERGFRGICSGI